MPRILDKKALRAKGVPFSNAHLLRLEAQGKFPRRFWISEGRIGWLEELVDTWIEERAASAEPHTKNSKNEAGRRMAAARGIRRDGCESPGSGGHDGDRSA
jgi:prophage regulatory protein